MICCLQQKNTKEKNTSYATGMHKIYDNGMEKRNKNPGRKKQFLGGKLRPSRPGFQTTKKYRKSE